MEAQGIGGDDFAFADDQGIAYVAVGGLDELVRVPVGSRAGAGQAVVVANVTAGPTSVRFARGGRGRSVYVSSNGGARGYLPGGRVEVGGRVSRVVLG